MGGCHAQTNTLLSILDAIVCILHEAPLLPFFFYLPAPKSPQVALAIEPSLILDMRLGI